MTREQVQSGAVSGRWETLDFLRGAAVIAMIGYHAAWNIGYFNLVDRYFLVTSAWRLFGATIAASFLMVSGFSLALAHSNGFRPRAFFKRLLKISAAAALVTAVTWYVFPDNYIFFGILHCLALTSVLALPFLYVPLWTGVIAIILTLFAPLFLQQSFWDQPWLDWLGFGFIEPHTNDYVPVFPWFAFVLFGVVLGRLANYMPQLFATEQMETRFFRRMVWLGRWSLAIYLIHQPILFGATQLVVVSGIFSQPVSPATAFRRHCEMRCRETSANMDTCYATCDCVTQRLTETSEYAEIWQRVKANSGTPQDREQVYQLAALCYQQRLP